MVDDAPPAGAPPGGFRDRSDSRRGGFSRGEQANRTGNPQVQQLFARISQEIEEKSPSNVIFFIVDFLCKHYPCHLGGFASVWNGDADLERDRLQVVEFFRYQKLPTTIAAQFIEAGFDTLETLCTVTRESLDTIEHCSEVPWRAGHRVRLIQTFGDICNRVRAFRQEREKLLHIARLTSGHCDHPTVITRTNVPHVRVPASTIGPNPLPHIQALPAEPIVHHVMPPPMAGASLGAPGCPPFLATPL